MIRISILFCIALLTSSCISQPPYNTKPKDDTTEDTTPSEDTYLYPFASEVHNPQAIITLETDGTKEISLDDFEIPYLKYNKSILVMLTQDDCRQDSYCRTWAKFNGQPVSDSQDKYYFTSDQLKAGDLHPSTIGASTPLLTTDGTGKDIRLAFSTTLLPENSSMKKYPDVKKGYTRDYYRFFMQASLNWHDVADILNYGNGIAFHDVSATDVNDATDILTHLKMAQDSALKYLNGRGIKFLAEPNGNKNYLNAAYQYPMIKLTTAQNGNLTTLYPFQITKDLINTTIKRIFFDDPNQAKSYILSQVALPKEQREAIYFGIHGVNNEWLSLFSWIDQTYGKDGDDSLWMPSQEEYYEYLYYKFNSKIKIEKQSQTNYTITIDIPTQDYFYFPSITLNIKDLKKSNIKSISTNTVINGFSYGDYDQGIMMNIDCRNSLVSHATHFVEVYEKEKDNISKKNDATYFVNLIKDSPDKTSLLQRIR